MGPEFWAIAGYIAGYAAIGASVFTAFRMTLEAMGFLVDGKGSFLSWDHPMWIFIIMFWPVMTPVAIGYTISMIPKAVRHLREKREKALREQREEIARHAAQLKVLLEDEDRKAQMEVARKEYVAKYGDDSWITEQAARPETIGTGAFRFTETKTERRTHR
jgi:hypothetical protein